MKQAAFLLIPSFLIVFACVCPAQQWSEPVQVSDLPAGQLDPDMCIDNNGVIHVVWSKCITYEFWKILYSYSEDDGDTWSMDYDVAQNDTFWLSQPHIAHDSQNKLFVTYDYDTYNYAITMVHLQVFDGIQWSEPILVSEGMPGSDYNNVIVDLNDRVFIFWCLDGLFNYYRIYQNNELGEIMEPYYNSLPDAYSLYYESIDTNQIMHWIGYTTENMPIWFAHAYFTYNILTNEWGVPINLLGTNAEIGNDIDLNIYNYPEILIRQQTSYYPYHDGTFYMYKDNQGWSEPELIVEDPYDQRIAIDQLNKTHIVEREKTVTGYQMVHYRKIDDEWIGYVIDSTPNFCNPTKLIYHNSRLYLVYFRNYIPMGYDGHIMFTKYGLISNVQNPEAEISSFIIYPNPASAEVFFEFSNLHESGITLMITDMSGKHVKTIIKGNVASGKHNIEWDCKAENGNKVSSGVYLCRLYAGRNVITRSLEIIK